MEPDAKTQIQLLADRILAGETPSKDEMRAAIAALRENRATAIVTAASRGSRKSSTPARDLNDVLSNFGL